MIIGIDIGGSTTKIVGIQNGKIINPLTVEANDPIASASGAMGKFLSVNSLGLKDIKKVRLTGVGATFLDNTLLGIPIEKVDEFRSLGYGGLFLSDLRQGIIVSMGTGTAFVKAHGRCVSHLGGTGMGGGTIKGLARAMVNLSSIDSVIALATKGKLTHVDLSIGDISHSVIGNLPSTLTASNFGKMNDDASAADVSLAILNMVFQVVGMMAIFAARTHKDTDIVMTGKLVSIPPAQKIFRELSRLYRVRFHVPNHASYCTAIGAAIFGEAEEFIAG